MRCAADARGCVGPDIMYRQSGVDASIYVMRARSSTRCERDGRRDVCTCSASPWRSAPLESASRARHARSLGEFFGGFLSKFSAPLNAAPSARVTDTRDGHTRARAPTPPRTPSSSPPSPLPPATSPRPLVDLGPICAGRMNSKRAAAIATVPLPTVAGCVAGFQPGHPKNPARSTHARTMRAKTSHTCRAAHSTHSVGDAISRRISRRRSLGADLAPASQQHSAGPSAPAPPATTPQAAQGAPSHRPARLGAW